MALEKGVAPRIEIADFNQAQAWIDLGVKHFCIGWDLGIIAAWCHKQDLFQDDRFMISENESGYIDQCLMSMCSDFIIANSSFSWWAAWLGNRGKVIAPKKWFPDDKHNTKDLYCKGWKVI